MSLVTSINEVPVTKQRAPRATVAASRENPNGTPGRNIKNRTVLQQHVDFFDTDRDGIIRLFDTYRGFRALGFNVIFCFFAVVVIHGSFSWITQPYWIPNPAFLIYTDNIHKGKHGSDSETYDSEGRFVPEKFEEIFSKYDRDNKGGLNLMDIFRMMYGNANVADFFGWFATVFEWGTMWLLANKNGILYKEDVRAQYDGSFFYKIAEKRVKNRKSYFSGRYEESMTHGKHKSK
ncbi:3779_t:CDS:2 [Ambispora gerdemannii]|uniref:3779_t:CDS:1 n=1 Tax=Ambispora gerdemannii TaxID=144530 RepID=A0A9N9A9U0_9GLOM|nr:3779_t:CDS:2 [Ambispora gerdemannii]